MPGGAGPAHLNLEKNLEYQILEFTGEGGKWELESCMKGFP